MRRLNPAGKHQALRPRAARAGERKKVVAYIRERIADTSALAKRNRVTAAEAMQLNRRLNALADEIEQGMHL